MRAKTLLNGGLPNSTVKLLLGVLKTFLHEKNVDFYITIYEHGDLFCQCVKCHFEYTI